ncbi:AIG1 family-domain-containing protein [Rhizophagus diaphanus]|nr:AIG1 family-domain-containing protein [Rhizophagus diaphanus] [Rhizophagus sp. MUCL 43196]
MNVQNEAELFTVGAGKSTLGNQLLGNRDNKPFTASSSFKSKTSKCEVATLKINNKNYDLVDTPGLFDTHGNVDPLKEITEFVNQCAGGVRSILLVLEAGRITDEEKNVLNTIRNFLGKDATNNFIVVFSKADPERVMDKQIDWNEIEILNSFITQIGYRWHVSPMRRYYNEDERKANEKRLMEIKECISHIQVLYTTTRFEENQKEQKRLKEEAEKAERRKKEEDENRIREDAIRVYKAEQQAEQDKPLARQEELLLKQEELLTKQEELLTKHEEILAKHQELLDELEYERKINLYQNKDSNSREVGKYKKLSITQKAIYGAKAGIDLAPNNEVLAKITGLTGALVGFSKGISDELEKL